MATEDEVKAAAARLKEGEYIAWTGAGGPDECGHGFAAGVPCPDCDRATLDAWVKSRTLASAVEQLQAAQFSPMGDNHHNAAKCPYCNPELETLRAQAEEAGIRKALAMARSERLRTHDALVAKGPKEQLEDVEVLHWTYTRAVLDVENAILSLLSAPDEGKQS